MIVDITKLRIKKKVELYREERLVHAHFGMTPPAERFP